MSKVNQMMFSEVIAKMSEGIENLRNKKTSVEAASVEARQFGNLTAMIGHNLKAAKMAGAAIIEGAPLPDFGVAKD